MGIGLALIGLNADVASANAVDQRDDADTEDPGAVAAADLTDGTQASRVPILTALQVKSTDGSKAPSILDTRSSASDPAPLRFSSVIDELPDEDAQQELVAQMSDPDSALSVIPSPSVSIPFEADSTYRLAQSDASLAGSEAQAAILPGSSSPSGAIAPGSGLQPATETSALTARPPSSAFQPSQPFHLQPSDTVQSGAREAGFSDALHESSTDPHGQGVPDSIQIAYNPDFERSQQTDDEIITLYPDAIDDFPEAEAIASVASGPGSAPLTARTPAALPSILPHSPRPYAAADGFTFRPPMTVETPTPQAIAYNPDFTSPQSFMPQVPMIGGPSTETYQPSAFSLSPQVPLAYLHPSLPPASLDALPAVGVNADAVLLPVPSQPPTGRVGRLASNPLPPPPSLPSIQTLWASSAPPTAPVQPRGGADPTTLPIVRSLAGLNGSASTPAGWPAPASSSYMTPIPIPQSLPWAAPPASPTVPVPQSLPWMAAAAQGVTPAPLPFAPAGLPVQTPSNPLPGNYGSSGSVPSRFDPSAPYVPAMTAPLPTPYTTSMTWAGATPERLQPSLVPVAESLPWGRSPTPQPSPVPVVDSWFAPPPAAPQISMAAPPVAPGVFNPSNPTNFATSDAWNGPVSSSVPPSWMNSPLVGQVPSPSYPVLIPVEPVPAGYPTAPPVQNQAQSTFPPPATPSPTAAQEPLVDRGPVTPPSLQVQGAVLLQGDNFSARGRLTGNYYLTPQIMVGGTLDIAEGEDFSDTDTEGFSVNELYLAAALRDLPNLRFVVGQLDLTSYFDRNSFAKDSLTHFFNPTFQTNPALASSSIGSRPGALINFTPTDNIEVRAAAFSSDRSIADFELDGFAGEVGFRVGNLILRGTYVSARDGGSDTGPAEIFSFDRGDGEFGIEEDDREESFGFNAEFFIPEVNIGLFARYGHYENLDADFSGDTFSAGINALDVFMRNDRIGLAYGRALSNNDLRQELDNKNPDVLEVFYDFPLLRNTRLGFTLQQRDEFSETVAGFRVRTTFDVFP